MVGNHIRPSFVSQPAGLPTSDSLLLMPSATPYETGKMEPILPSAKSFNCFRLRQKILWVEVIHRLPRLSSSMPASVLLGRPFLVVIAFNWPSRKRVNP